MNFLLKLDWMIILCILLLSGVGAAAIASVAPDLFVSQIIFYILGLSLFLFFSRLDFRIFPSLGKIIFLASIVLLGITLILGFESHGAVRWVAIGPFRLQFSEFLKPFLITALAVSFRALSERYSFRSYLRLIVIISIPLFLVFKQPDLGSALVYLFVFAVLSVISIPKFWHLFLFGVSTLITIPFFWKFLASYQKARILTFLSPTFDPLGASYNAIQAVITVGSGEFFGRGLGRGTQSHLLFLPEHHTDFIFASIAEELGFLGSFFILAIYFVLIWHLFSLASKSKNVTGSLIILGIASMFLIQVLINVGMNLGILPVTGIPLPLISYGGSSILSCLISLGIVENIAGLENRPD